MSKQITINIEDTMCISKEWLDKEIEQLEEYRYDNESNQGFIKSLIFIKSQLFPSKVLVEKALYTGYGIGFNYSDFEERTQTFLTSPITINIEEDNK